MHPYKLEINKRNYFKMMNLIVDNCPTCEPLFKLIKILRENNFQIIEQKVNDYHFHELYFKFKGDIGKLSKINFDLNGIERHNDNKFIYTCHWSTVEIVSMDFIFPISLSL